MRTADWWNDAEWGKNCGTGRTTFPTATSSATDPIWIGVGSNTVLCNEDQGSATCRPIVHPLVDGRINVERWWSVN